MTKISEYKEKKIQKQFETDDNDFIANFVYNQDGQYE